MTNEISPAADPNAPIPAGDPSVAADPNALSASDPNASAVGDGSDPSVDPNAPIPAAELSPPAGEPAPAAPEDPSAAEAAPALAEATRAPQEETSGDRTQHVGELEIARQHAVAAEADAHDAAVEASLAAELEAKALAEEA